MQDEPRNKQLLYAMLPRRVNDVGLDDQVVAKKLGWIRVVGVNAADLRGRQVHLVDIISGKPCIYFRLVAEIQFVATGDNRFYAVRLQPTNDGRTHQAFMACNKYLAHCRSAYSWWSKVW